MNKLALISFCVINLFCKVSSAADEFTSFRNDLGYELRIPKMWALIVGPGNVETADPTKSDMIDIVPKKGVQVKADGITFNIEGASIIVGFFPSEKEKAEAIASSKRAMQSSNKPKFFSVTESKSAPITLRVLQIEKGYYRWRKLMFCGLREYSLEVSAKVSPPKEFERKLRTDFFVPPILQEMFDSYRCK